MLKLENVTVKYDAAGSACALENIRLAIDTGERVALIGANGAGKSSLLLTIIGMLVPVSGSVSLDGVAVEKKTLREIRKKIGMVFQNPDDQLFMPSVYDDIAFGPRNYGIQEAEIDRRADDILERLGIAHLKGRMSHKLSGGEKRLAALAGVLIMEPSLLLLDEPSAFLDPRSRRRLISILSDLPHTMVIATHDLDMALELCERTVLLKEGQIYADGPTRSLLCDKQTLDDCGLELPLSLSRCDSGFPDTKS